MSNQKPDLSRTDSESLLRPALYELVCAVSALESRWGVAGPIERGRMWERMVDARKDGSRVYNAVPDPLPLQCAHTWFDQLDNVWDRCGLPPRHKGHHVACYMLATASADGGKEAHNDQGRA